MLSAPSCKPTAGPASCRRIRGPRPNPALLLTLPHFDFWLQNGGMRLSPTACLATGLLLVASPADAAEGVAALVEAGAKEAGLALAGPKPFVDIVCPIMQQQAEARGLPPMPFVRLIWKESRFNPQAVSPKGAQGIAQFMPGTAEERGLQDPFEPKSAIVHSASLLADLRREFGNFGLAAAAYNAGAERVRGWLSGLSKLPYETQNYVEFVTGRAAEEWKLAETELPEALKTAGVEVQELLPQACAAGGAGGVRDRAAYGERRLAALGRAGLDLVLQVEGAGSVRQAQAAIQFAARRARTLRAAGAESEPRAALDVYGPDRLRQPR